MCEVCIPTKYKFSDLTVLSLTRDDKIDNDYEQIKSIDGGIFPLCVDGDVFFMFI